MCRSIDMYAESDEGQGKPSQVVHGFLKVQPYCLLITTSGISVSVGSLPWGAQPCASLPASCATTKMFCQHWNHGACTCKGPQASISVVLRTAWWMSIGPGQSLPYNDPCAINRAVDASCRAPPGPQAHC